MNKALKLVAMVAAVIVMFFGYMVFDWYRFATAGKIDPARGVYGNDHLEIWIDVNARMPNDWRLWACKTLLDRQAAVMGGEGAMPPYSCQPDFQSYSKPLTHIETIISGHAHQAAQLAGMQKGATQAQQDQIMACVKAELPKALTPEQATSLEGELTGEVLMPINQLANTVREACLAKAGL